MKAEIKRTEDTDGVECVWTGAEWERNEAQPERTEAVRRGMKMKQRYVAETKPVETEERTESRIERSEIGRERNGAD